MTVDPDLPLLSHPTGGIPDVITTPNGLADLCHRISEHTGPIAFDAERASGYRYTSRAYLIQGYRRGLGSFLIDPVALPDLSSIPAAAPDAEWVLHAASQDVECMREVGLTPPAGLFDTELGGRLAGFERVGLATMVATCLGMRLAKEHSAVDWSVRPLPEPWLRYAVLDVEVLLDLRDRVAETLAEQNKTEWARQEFTAVANRQQARKTDPWRRVSGSHVLRKAPQRAMLRELWHTRDTIARDRDVAPTRLLPDRALVAIIRATPSSLATLQALPEMRQVRDKTLLPTWLDALHRSKDLPKDQWPTPAPAPDGPPAPKLWKDRDPTAAARLRRAKAALTKLSADVNVPLENLMLPDTVRRICWEPASTSDLDALAAQMRELCARPWQIDTCAPLILAAWRKPAETTSHTA